MRQRIPVYILAGQSNMAGRGDVRDPGVSQSLAELFDLVGESVLYDYVCSFGADRGEPFESGGAYRSSGFVRLAQCKKHPSTDSGHFGPELSFARRILDIYRADTSPNLPDDRRIAVIKHGRGGTNLHADWDPAATSGRQLYRKMLEQYRSRSADLEALGYQPVLSGFCWLQGEGDTLREDTAGRYQESFSRVVDSVRLDLDSPDLAFVAVQIKPGADRHPRTGQPWMVYSDIVQRALRNVVESKSACGLVETEDLATIDQVHIAAPGLLEVGRRMADSIASIHERTPSP